MPKFEDIARLPIIDSKWYFDKDYQVLKWGLFQRFCYITFLKFLSWYILLQKAKFFLKPATSKAQRCSFLGYFFFWWKFVFWRFTQRSWILNISLLFKPWTSKLLLISAFAMSGQKIYLFWRSWESIMNSSANRGYLVHTMFILCTHIHSSVMLFDIKGKG